MKTKFGNAEIDNNGYYVITSRREGNHNKLLHRLIYESFWNVKLPEEVHVHHKDGNKLNNCILNLESLLASDHRKLHMSGENNPMWNKKHLEESKMKISKARNTTGYLNVYKHKDKRYKQGFIWSYRYYGDGKYKEIGSVSLEKLEEKVKKRGLLWHVFEDGDSNDDCHY